MKSDTLSWIRVCLLASLLAALGLSGALLVNAWLASRAARPLSLGEGPLAPSSTPAHSAPLVSTDLSKPNAPAIDFVLAIKSSDKQPLPSRIRISERTAAGAATKPHVDTLENARDGSAGDASPFLDFFAGSSDESGRIGFRLAPGEYRVTVVPKDLRYRAFDRGVSVARNWDGVEVQIELPVCKGAIRGRVNGWPGGDAAATVFLDRGKASERRASVQPDGTFHLDALRGGRLQLELDLGGLAPRYVALAPRDLQLAEDQVRTDVEFALQTAVTLRGRVTTAGGKDVSDVRVRATARRSGRSHMVLTDEQGRFQLASLETDTHELEVLHPWSDRPLCPKLTVFEKDLGQSGLTVFVAPEQARLLGRVVTADGAGLPGARLRIVLPETARVLEQESDPEGRFEFDDLFAGPYPIRVQPSDDRYLQRSDLVLNAERDPVPSVIRLEESSTLVITPTSKGAGAYEVTVLGGEAFFLSRRYQGEASELRLGGLPSGRFEVCLSEQSEHGEQRCAWHVQLEPGSVARLTADG
jgi:Carboxypeptidase regulatory-like domain